MAVRNGSRTLSSAPEVTCLDTGGSIRGTAVGSASTYEKLVLAIDVNTIKPPIDQRFPFEQVREAYAAQASPSVFGKIVIDLGAS